MIVLTPVLLSVQRAGVVQRCVFHEMHAMNGFTEFQSAANKSWYIGFNRRGRRLPGDAARWAKKRPRRRRCYQFVKTGFPHVGRGVEDQRPPRKVTGDGSDVGKVDWYSWIASRRRTEVSAVT